MDIFSPEIRLNQFALQGTCPLSGGSEPIPTALSEKVRDFLHKGGGLYLRSLSLNGYFFLFWGIK